MSTKIKILDETMNHLDHSKSMKRTSGEQLIPEIDTLQNFINNYQLYTEQVLLPLKRDLKKLLSNWQN